jgi:hypothetical protein
VQPLRGRSWRAPLGARHSPRRLLVHLTAVVGVCLLLASCSPAKRSPATPVGGSGCRDKGDGLLALEGAPSALCGYKIAIPRGGLRQGANPALRVATEQRPPTRADPPVAILEATPSGLEFAVPVVVTLGYHDRDGDGIVDGTTIPERALQAFIYSEESSAWLPLTTVGVDPAKDTLSFATTHFSMIEVKRPPNIAKQDTPVRWCSQLPESKRAAILGAIDFWSQKLEPMGVTFTETKPDATGICDPEIIDVLFISETLKLDTCKDGKSECYTHAQVIHYLEPRLFDIVVLNDAQAPDLAYTPSLLQIMRHEFGHLFGLPDLPQEPGDRSDPLPLMWVPCDLPGCWEQLTDVDLRYFRMSFAVYFSDERPSGKTDDRRPTIGVTMTSPKDPDIRIDRTRLLLDGQHLPLNQNDFKFAPPRDSPQVTMSYRPAADLALGQHKVMVEAYDSAGNSSVWEWSFELVNEGAETAPIRIRFLNNVGRTRVLPPEEPDSGPYYKYPGLTCRLNETYPRAYIFGLILVEADEPLASVEWTVSPPPEFVPNQVSPPVDEQGRGRMSVGGDRTWNFQVNYRRPPDRDGPVTWKIIVTATASNGQSMSARHQLRC